MLDNLRHLRNERGISQQKLADEVGVSQSSINKYENHNIEPDISTLIRLSEFFETSVDYLVGHTHIRSVIGGAGEYTLDHREVSLVDGYRQLPESSRRILDDLIAELLQK